MDNKKIIVILLTIFIYILSTGVSYAFFSQVPSSSKKVITSPLPSKDSGLSGVKFDQGLPKTEACPLNGAMYSKQQRDWWERHRPLGVMIENHEEARPQSGLSSADIIYEVVAEGGITRFLAMYYCQDAPQVGPVRSARTYFLDFVSEYGDYPLYVHVGGANQDGPADALSQIGDYGWTSYNDLNQFSIGFPTFWRDYDRLGRTVATEHTMYSTTTKLWDFAAKSRDLTNVDKDSEVWDKNFVSYTFKEDAEVSARPVEQAISLEFWKGYSKYFVEWVYDQASNLYKRKNGATSHVDKNNDKQLTAKNIIVLSMQESNANDGYENNVHLLYRTKGSGKATIFMDGKKILGTWRKASRTSKTLIFDSAGSPVKFNKGTIWFEVLPLQGELIIK